MPHENDAAQNFKDLFWFRLNLGLTALIILVQLLGGIYSGSQALIADTVHVFVHAITEIIVIFTLWSGSKKLDRVGSWLIVLLLLGLLLPWLIWEAWERYLHPQDIVAPLMLTASLIGLLVNGVQRLIVRGRGLSSKSVARYKVCLDTDIYSSLGVLIGAGIIYFHPAWLIIDTVIAFLIAGLVIWKVTTMSKISKC